jgi:transcriptional antiterminator NusG
MAAGWYVLHVYSGYERKIEKVVRLKITSGEFDKNIIREVKAPIEEVSEIKDGKKRVIKRLFYPGYLLVEIDMPDEKWQAVCQQIRAVEGVTGFVGTPPNKKPVPLGADEARDILQRAGEIKGDKSVRTRISFQVGDHVKITAGPFESFSGAIEEVILDKNKLHVAVGIFGRNVPVEVDMNQVERV